MREKRLPELINIDGWPFRIRKAKQRDKPNRILLLLHGHLGNEDVMWIFTKNIPENYTILSPRAPLKLGKNQFSWHKIGPASPNILQYQELTAEVLSRVNEWLADNHIDAEMFDLLGFSQGAVMAYALVILQPESINRVAAIAGFIPSMWKERLSEVNLQGKQFFIAHGTQDEIIPIGKAIQAKEWLEEQNALVKFCEADIGHKLSANCFNSLETFYK